MDEACRNDSALTREVHALLDHASRMGSFLEEPALGADFGMASQEALAAEDLTGRLVGRYRLERCIGSGGMGTVYLGELLYARQSLDEAQAMFEQALDVFREASGARSPDAARALSRARGRHGSCPEHRGDLLAALAPGRS